MFYVAISVSPRMFTYFNRPVSQMRAFLEFYRELVLDYNTVPKLLDVFEHQTKYVIIHAPYTRIVVFWHISNIPHMNS